MISVSIPVGLSKYCLLDNKLMKNVCFYFKLKSMYVGGIIKNYKSQYLSIREVNTKLHKNTYELIKPSEEWVRRSINELKTFGWIQIDGDNLLINSTKKVFKTNEYWSDDSVYKLAKYKRINIPVTELYMLEEILISDALEENKRQQEYKILDKIIKEEIKEKGITKAGNNLHKATSGYNAAVKNIKKSIENNFENYFNKYSKRFFSDLSNYFKSSLNPLPIFTRNLLCKLSNKSYNWSINTINRLKNLKLVTEKKYYFNTKRLVNREILSEVHSTGINGFIGKTGFLILNLGSSLEFKSYSTK